MADDSDLERTYPATPHRIEQAREKGQVARSRELTAAAVALVAAIGTWSLGPAFAQRCIRLVHDGLSFDRDAAFESARMGADLGTASAGMLLALAPLLGIVLLATLGAPMIVSGWVCASQALTPDFTRLNPLSGLKNIVSKHSLAELFKALAKSMLLGLVGGFAIYQSWGELESLVQSDVTAGINHVGSLVIGAVFLLVGALVLVAAIDVPYQLWSYYDRLKMTREELRQELKEQEGDPQLKARIRSLQRQAARKRMMAAVPTASVVVTNPSHYAVALEYREGMAAPKVVAKGMDLVAQKIREIAQANRVPLLEAPPLARALHRHADVGDAIPQALYSAVAQVLAYVYQVQRWRAAGGAMPEAPKDLDVPSALDPLNARGAQTGEGA